MQRVRASGTRFALHDGYPIEDSPFVYLASADEMCAPGWSGALLLLVEPLEPAPGATEAAAEVIATMCAALAGVPADDAIARLADAYQAANVLLYRENIQRPPRRRIYLGVTTVVLCGPDLFVAQTPPGQLLVRQDDALYAFPSLASWQPDFQPSRTYDLPNPLGLRFQVEPDVYYSQAAPGDLLLALSSKLARAVASLEEEFRLSQGPDDALASIVATCERQFVATGHGAVALVPRRHLDDRPAPARRLPDELQTFDFAAWEANGSREVVADVAESRSWDTAPLDPDVFSVQTEGAHEEGLDAVVLPAWEQPVSGTFQPAPRAAAPAEFRPARPRGVTERRSRPPALVGGNAAHGETSDLPWARPEQEFVRFGNDAAHFARRPSSSTHDVHAQAFDYRPGDNIAASLTAPGPSRARGTGPMELLAGLLLSLTAAVVGVWQITKRDRPIHGPVDDGSFGLPRLQRWDESYRPPRMQRLRSRAPRLEVSRAVLLTFLVLLVAGGAFFAYSRAVSREAVTASEFAAAMQQIEARRVEAAGLADRATAFVVLTDAQAKLERAAALEGADPAQVSTMRGQLAADIANVSGAQRLSNVQVVGGVPPAPRGMTPRLVSGGGKLFLLSDAVYQVDTFNSSLVVLLSVGDIVNDEPVRPLRGLTWREDRLVVMDATRSYAFDMSRGAWAVEPLATFDTAGYTSVAAVEAFDRNLYVLAPDSGQILKFQAGGYDMAPEDWTGGLANNELRQGVDMAIDGHVLVLLEDGRILDFFRARLEATLTPQVVPPLERAAALVAPLGSQYLYLLHATDGRIIRLARDGTVVQQFTSASLGAVPVLSGAVDLSIDEAAGLAYILANDTIYTVRIPPPPAQ
jgi:hypothetical protein